LSAETVIEGGGEAAPDAAPLAHASVAAILDHDRCPAGAPVSAATLMNTSDDENDGEEADQDEGGGDKAYSDSGEALW